MTSPHGLAFRLALRLWLAGLLIFGLVAAFIIFRTPAAFFQLLDSAGNVIEQSDFAEAALVSPAFRNPARQTPPGYLTLDGRVFHCLLRPLPALQEHGQGEYAQDESGDAQNNRHQDGDNSEIRQENSWRASSGAVWLAVGVDRTDVVRQIRTTVWLTLAATGIGLLLLCLLAWLLVRHALRPLTALRGALAQTDEHNLAPVAINAPDEIGAVITTLNRLIGQLAGAFARERAFTADAAHELRTPIAELRLVAEVALRRPKLTEESRHEYAAILATAQRMQGLVEKLLLLARADAGGLAASAAPVPLLPLLTDLLTAHRPAAEKRRLTLHAGIPAGAIFSTDAALLRIILDNLIGNAVAYAAPGSAIAVRAASGAGGLHLSVSNTAPCLQLADCERMFDRFWRRDSARTAGGGSGLGLALARALAQLLGGTLTATVSTPATVQFTLQLPAGPSRPAPSGAKAS